MLGIVQKDGHLKVVRINVCCKTLCSALLRVKPSSLGRRTRCDEPVSARSQVALTVI
uniref:Uncharacterized protein n=1 Tax=Setaria italica TaxID=4555 RepID=K3YBK6_SETIT